MNYIDNAKIWYKQNKDQVDKLIKNSKKPFAVRPSLEDYNSPELWRADHWIWFLKEVDKKK